MRPRRIALIVVVIGLVCLPAPLYLGWAAKATAPPPQTSQIYYADPLDPANETDRDRIVDRHATAVALSTHQVSEQYSAGDYQAPTETQRTLEHAMASGSASTDDAGARADLQNIARNYSFVYDAYDDRDQYYRLNVADGGASVRADPVTTDEVANATVEEAAFTYAELSAREQETVDRILVNSTDDEYGYRPRVNDPFVDELPALVQKEETLYSIVVNGHVDDFGPGFSGFLLGLAGAGVGLVLLLAGGGIYGYVWWQEQRRESVDPLDND